MMKKKVLLLCILMICLAVLAGCSTPGSAETPNSSQNTNTAKTLDASQNTNTAQTPDASQNAAGESISESVTISPLPVTISPEQLDNCTVAVSLEEGGAFVDDNGTMQMNVTVYTYDLYDMVDISQMKEGDIFIRCGEEVEITSLARSETGSVAINGGLDHGGFELWTTDNTVFFECGYSDVKSYYALGEATVPVSPDFTYTDKSDLDKDAVVYYPGDFLTEGTGIDYHFTPHNTSITIENGYVISMTRVYTP